MYTPTPAGPSTPATGGGDGFLGKVNAAVSQMKEDESEKPNRLDKEFPMELKSWKHIFTSETAWRWVFTHHYQEPNYRYQDGTIYRHRDYAGRIKKKTMSDRYLHHWNGYLRKLIVQCTDDMFERTGTTTWRRTYVRKVSPLVVRIATWVIDFSYDPDSWSDWGVQLLRAFPAALAMMFCSWTAADNTRFNGGYYSPINYTFHGEAKVWSNHLENIPSQHSASAISRTNEVYRAVKPRFLCFLNNPHSHEQGGVVPMAVEEWERAHPDSVLEYVFLGYTAEQFRGNDDLNALHYIGEIAAKQNGCIAFWCAASCMRVQEDIESEVYRIADVLRGAKKMVIALSTPYAPLPDNRKGNMEALLAQWGTRMWTFPEVLLSPGDTIDVYNRAVDLQTPIPVPKNQFASLAWADAVDSKQLIDHYLSKIQLSRLELAVIALRCLFSRQTDPYMRGDQSYALMGLLRMRPQIDRNDTAFQAFARLSLANDSDLLLERYLNLLPKSLDQPWYNMEDQYDAALWDITPSCQVAAICDEDTVVIDGCRGASIRWKSFLPIQGTTHPSWKRWFATILLLNNGWFFTIAIILFATSTVTTTTFFGDTTTTTDTGRIIAGIVFLLLWLWAFIMTPKLVRVIYGGKFHDVQAALFGVEGYLNPPTVERAIFGGNFQRMGWSQAGSPLSRCAINKFGERVGVDPRSDPLVLEKIERAKFAKPGELRIWTLVDTWNMELTLFEAVNPPTVVFLGASEGGMQRAIACSYDWTTQTFYRETVLRMPTTSLNRMDRVPRVRIGTSRPNDPKWVSTPVKVAQQPQPVAV